MRRCRSTEAIGAGSVCLTTGPVDLHSHCHLLKMRHSVDSSRIDVVSYSALWNWISCCARVRQFLRPMPSLKMHPHSDAVWFCAIEVTQSHVVVVVVDALRVRVPVSHPVSVQFDAVACRVYNPWHSADATRSHLRDPHARRDDTCAHRVTRIDPSHFAECVTFL